MIADEDHDQDRAHREKIQSLRDKLRNEDFAKPGYMKAYCQKISIKLKQDMDDLVIGLRLHGVEVVTSVS